MYTSLKNLVALVGEITSYHGCNLNLPIASLRLGDESKSVTIQRLRNGLISVGAWAAYNETPEGLMLFDAKYDKWSPLYYARRRHGSDFTDVRDENPKILGVHIEIMTGRLTAFKGHNSPVMHLLNCAPNTSWLLGANGQVVGCEPADGVFSPSELRSIVGHPLSVIYAEEWSMIFSTEKRGSASDVNWLATRLAGFDIQRDYLSGDVLLCERNRF